MKSKDKLFKRYENPSHLVIYIENRETNVKITLDTNEGLGFILEFTFNDRLFKKVFNKISTKEVHYDSADIEFDGIDLHQIYKEKIAQCMNEKLDYHFE